MLIGYMVTLRSWGMLKLLGTILLRCESVTSNINCEPRRLMPDIISALTAASASAGSILGKSFTIEPTCEGSEPLSIHIINRYSNLDEVTMAGGVFWVWSAASHIVVDCDKPVL